VRRSHRRLHRSADQRSGRRSAHGPLGAGSLAGLGDLLLGRRSLLLLLFGLFGQVERIDAGVLDRPLVTFGLVSRLLGGVLSLSWKDVDLDGRRQALLIVGVQGADGGKSDEQTQRKNRIESH
jgi:hypothetical protein